jgi:hypothetical protein
MRFFKVEIFKRKFVGGLTMGLEALAKANKHVPPVAKADIPVPVNVASFESVISTGQNALKSIIMLNGGAVVALLAFVGATWNKFANPAMVKTLLIAMMLFDAGVLLSSVAAGVTYLGQRAYYCEKNKAGDVYVWLTIFLVVLAYILFIVASGVAVWGFWSGQLPPEHQ